MKKNQQRWDEDEEEGEDWGFQKIKRKRDHQERKHERDCRNKRERRERR